MATSFETVFKSALANNLAKFGADIAAGQAGAKLSEPRDSVIMNISSVMFKAVIVFGFPRTNAARSAFEPHVPEGGDSTVQDIYCDIGNMVCGHVNRCLSHTYRFSGISTPIVLDDDQMTAGLFEMPCTEKIAIEATTPAGACLRLWAFISSGDAALNFDAAAGENSANSFELVDGDAEGGELELF